jgi:hypothetical protein
LVLILVAFMTACQGNSPSADGTSGPTLADCTSCHDDTTTILAKTMQWEATTHSDFEVAASEGTNKSCAGCHTSEGYIARIAANIAPNQVAAGETNPTPPSCFACHEIHSTYTTADYTLRTVAPVNMYISGKTFDIGQANLCASCHQARTAAPTVGSGDVNVSSTHWGPHHSNQADFILATSTAGYGVTGNASPHSLAVKDNCVTCHMPDANHQMEPGIATCQTCHPGVTSFDIDGVQTAIQTQLDELSTLLTSKGLLKNGNPVVGKYSEAQAGALWNYEAVSSDGSLGVHNPAYTKALLQNAIDALK